MLNRLKNYYFNFHTDSSPDGKLRNSILSTLLESNHDLEPKLLEDIEKYVELYRRGSSTLPIHPLVEKYERF